MRVTIVSCVRDEIDVVEPFVRHCAAVSSRVLILDHASSDGTRDVLTALQREGLPLEVAEDQGHGYYQSQRVTALVHRAATDRPDWIVPLDCDEFLVPGDGLLDHPTGEEPGGLAAYNYVPSEDDPALEHNPVLRIRRRRRDPDPTWAKVAIPGSLAARPGLVVAQGNHGVLLDGRWLEPRGVVGSIQHFPVRSAAQALRKAVQARLENLAVPEADETWGYHFVPPFERAARSPARFLQTVELAARELALLPADVALVEAPATYLGGPLRYTPPAEEYLDRAASSLLRTAERLARARGESEKGRLAEASRAAELGAALEGARAQLAEARADCAQLRAAISEIENSSSVRVARLLRDHVPWLQRSLGAFYRRASSLGRWIRS